MDIQTIGSSSLTIYISPAEMRSRNIAPGSLTADDTKNILHSALDMIGQNEYTKVSLELFPGKEDLLLFVRMCLGAPLFFSFDDLELLIAAACECSDEAPSSLSFMDSRYILTVTPWEHDNAAPILYEFGELIDAPQQYEEYIKEHGQMLIKSDALTVLKKHFTKTL